LEHLGIIGNLVDLVVTFEGRAVGEQRRGQARNKAKERYRVTLHNSIWDDVKDKLNNSQYIKYIYIYNPE
jgi:hypothetical protein